MGIVPDKATMRKLLARGVFGNTLEVWFSLEDFLQSDYKGMCWIGQSRRAGEPLVLNIPADEVPEMYRQYIGRGESPDFTQICTSPPNELITIQGEIMRVERSVYSLYYSTLPLPIRQALKEGGVSLEGWARVTELLKKHMDPSSYDDLIWLLGEYPDSIIEFSCYTTNVGIFPHRNTLIQEVRNY